MPLALLIEGYMNMKTLLGGVLIFFVIISIPIIIYLWYQNRSSELLASKILSAFAVALFAILSALLIGLKSEERELKFASTVFFHKSDKRPLDDHLKEDGRLRFGGNQFIGKLSVFISKQLEECEDLNKAEFNKNPEKIVSFYHDMILTKLIDQFFWMYSARWDTNLYSVRRGTAESKGAYVDSSQPPPNYDSLNWKDLLNTEEQSSFYKRLSAFSNIEETKVPPKTKVDCIITERKRAIILQNPFVEVTITIYYSGGSSGLGDYKWLLGYHNKKSEDFWSAHFRVNCSAKFEKFRSGHPAMPKYRQWVEVMFGEVQYLLDEKEQLNRAHEYRNLREI